MGGPALRRERLAAACRFVLEQGRPLEAALLRFHFEGAPREGVLAALAAFQNDDGGFGRAIEPDLRAPESSAIATAVALQALREVGAVREGDVAGRALRWLLATLDRGLRTWRIVPKTAEASPHAPWWNQTGREARYEGFSLTPTAELLGCFCERPGAAPALVVQAVAEAVTAEVERTEKMEMHDLLSCLRLFASPGLPTALRDALADRLPHFVEGTVERDPSKWPEYGLRPLQAADDPASPFLAGLEIDVLRNLDYEVATQQPDGSWAPTWEWGEAFPDVWPAARREWCGILTVQRLVVLRRYGRIDAVPAATPAP